ncbi:Cytochrome c oxidase assembly protein cox18, mitochondrial [Orbilia ellipsospora]|uniref:Cytochrome c oxidase assembly protein cox18, mitochondrial n=1 Tax=Orbilia ellipsospora TaxID=2528407 RepID=A0AAV9WS67_9PEZI
MLRSTPSISRHLRHHHLRTIRPLLSHPLNHNGAPHPSSPRNGNSSHRTITTASTTINTALETTQSLILSLQSTTTLPWLFTIPLIALLIRTTVTLPFSIYAHKRAHVQTSLTPLLRAWTTIYSLQTAKEKYPNPPSASTPAGMAGRKVYGTPEEWQSEVLSRIRRKRKEVYRAFGCQYWKSYVGLMQMPVWFFASMSIRNVAGLEQRYSPYLSAFEKEDLSLLDGNDVDIIDNGSAGLGETAVVEEGPLAIAREQMHAGGIEGWFPDLLQPDPYMILPILFSLIVYTNLAWNNSRIRDAELIGWRKGINNALLVMSIAIFPMTLNSPSILHVYWITSSSYSLVQNVLLHKAFPKLRFVKPLKKKKPSYMRVKDTEA